MKFTKFLAGVSLHGFCLILAACSGVPQNNQSTGSGPTGAGTSATIGGSVTGLTGSGLVLQNNSGDSLNITADGSFTFKTAVTGAYAVTVLAQPASPNQICTVANGSGTASANVTNVAVTCVLAYTIGGTVNGLVGTGMVV